MAEAAGVDFDDPAVVLFLARRRRASKAAAALRLLRIVHPKDVQALAREFQAELEAAVAVPGEGDGPGGAGRGVGAGGAAQAIDTHESIVAKLAAAGVVAGGGVG